MSFYTPRGLFISIDCSATNKCLMMIFAVFISHAFLAETVVDSTHLLDFWSGDARLFTGSLVVLSVVFDRKHSGRGHDLN